MVENHEAVEARQIRHSIPKRFLATALSCGALLTGAAAIDTDPALGATGRTVACGPSTPMNKLPILSEGDRGSCVRYIQQLLVRHGDLSPASADGVFGEETTGRVIGFQIQNNIKGFDGSLSTGNVGPRTWRVARNNRTNQGLPLICREMTRGACVDKRRGVTMPIANGKPIRRFASGFGDSRSIEHRSDEGVFNVDFKSRFHRSTIYNNAPMPFAVFYNEGEAFHESESFENRSNGLYVGSHGCVNLEGGAARFMFRHLQAGDPVVVY